MTFRPRCPVCNRYLNQTNVESTKHVPGCTWRGPSNDVAEAIATALGANRVGKALKVRGGFVGKRTAKPARTSVVNPTAFTLINFQVSHASEGIASIHRAGCRDIGRDIQSHAGLAYQYTDTTLEAVLDNYIDDEMLEMGWTKDCVKVHACCHGK